jgi:hypothetical protein
MRFLADCLIAIAIVSVVIFWIYMIFSPSKPEAPVEVAPSAFKIISDDKVGFNFLVTVIADAYGQQFMVVRTAQGVVVLPYTVPAGIEPHKGF